MSVLRFHASMGRLVGNPELILSWHPSVQGSMHARARRGLRAIIVLQMLTTVPRYRAQTVDYVLIMWMIIPAAVLLATAETTVKATSMNAGVCLVSTVHVAWTQRAAQMKMMARVVQLGCSRVRMGPIRRAALQQLVRMSTCAHARLGGQE